MKKHEVIAEMVDAETGDRHLPGATFTPHSDEQAQRLIKARCLADPDEGLAQPKVVAGNAAKAKVAK